MTSLDSTVTMQYVLGEMSKIQCHCRKGYWQALWPYPVPRLPDQTNKSVWTKILKLDKFDEQRRHILVGKKTNKLKY